MTKQIPDYDNYLIYDNGDVLNTLTGKILKGSIGEHGYKYYRLSKNNTKKMFYAHRLVAEAARQLKLDSSTISKVCRGINKTHGGFHFRYIE